MSRVADVRELEVGMYFIGKAGTTYQVDGVDTEKIRLKDRDGVVTTLPMPTAPTAVEVVYEVTPEQAVATIERVLDGTEM